MNTVAACEERLAALRLQCVEAVRALNEPMREIMELHLRLDALRGNHRDLGFAWGFAWRAITEPMREVVEPAMQAAWRAQA